MSNIWWGKDDTSAELHVGSRESIETQGWE